jgi:hypothetical protein
MFILKIQNPGFAAIARFRWRAFLLGFCVATNDVYSRLGAKLE